MSEKNFNFKSLDLSKEPDQKKFDEEFGRLPENERKSLVDAAQEEAADMRVKTESYEAKDYIEVEKLLEGIEIKSIEDVEGINKERIELIKSSINDFLQFTIDEYLKEHKKSPEVSNNIIVRVEINIQEYLIKYLNNLDDSGNKKIFNDLLELVYKDKRHNEDFPPMAHILKRMLWEYDGNIRSNYIKECRSYFSSAGRSDFRGRRAGFVTEMFDQNPDVIFLAARSAIPWGIMYKEWADTFKKEFKKDNREDLALKVPSPQFKLADVKLKWLKEKEERDVVEERAVDRYMKKLEPVKEKIKAGTLKEPVKIAVFDEAVNTGATLNIQTEVMEQAIERLGINAEITQFAYTGDQVPNLPGVMHFIDKNYIAKRAPLSKHQSDLLNVIERLYERSNYKLFQEAGREQAQYILEASGKEYWIERLEKL